MVIIESCAVTGPIVDQVPRRHLRYVEVETELHERDFTTVGGMRADRGRETLASRNGKRIVRSLPWDEDLEEHLWFAGESRIFLVNPHKSATY